MTFEKVIGQHMQDAGLYDIWIECKILGPGVAEQVLSGKKHKKAMRCHKLTFQALWRIILPQFQQYVMTNNANVYETLQLCTVNDIDDVIRNPDIMELLDEYIKQKSSNPNFEFMWTYMEMVWILLLFTHAQRDGLWELHLYAFGRMLPFFFRYDHPNYSRWGAIYIAEMKS